MYSALCPNCGAAMAASYGGSVLARCSQCPWMGQVTFHFLPGKINFNPYGGGPLGFQPLPSMPPITITNPLTNPLGPDEAPPDPLEARREALWSRFHRIAGMVYDQLCTVDTEDWQMPAWRRYERLQRAHEALYVALGGVRMDDYHPTRAALDEALAGVLLWALLTLDAVER